MKEPRSWAEALNISPENLEKWGHEAPSEMPLLVWCLEQGHINKEAYFKFAQEEYGLPILDPSFFSTLDPAWIDKARAEHQWHAWNVPVSEWDGVTFVAVVEPPQDAPAENIRYVLADPQCLSEVWGQQAPNVIPPLPDSEVPVGFSGAAKPFRLNLEVPGEPTEESSSETPPLHIPIDVEASNSEIKSPPLQARQSLSGMKQAAEETFNRIMSRYSSALLMRCHGSEARMELWSSNIKLDSPPANSTVNLDYPTFLRIVKKTNQPYHGYLVDSPAHRDFFESLGMTELPACVTAIPLRNENEIAAILVCIGTDANQKSDSLAFAQDEADALAGDIESDLKKAA